MNDDSEIDVIMSDGFVSDHIDRNSEEFDRMCCTAASADDCGPIGDIGGRTEEIVWPDVAISGKTKDAYVDEMVDRQFRMWGVGYPSGSMKRRLKREMQRRLDAKQPLLTKHPGHSYGR